MHGLNRSDLHHYYKFAGSKMRHLKTCNRIKALFMLLLDAFLVTLLVVAYPTGKYLLGLYLQPQSYEDQDSTPDWQPQISEPVSSEEIKTLLNRIPHVSEVNCSRFTVPPEQWNSTLEQISKTVPAMELVPEIYDDCDLITSSWLKVPVSQFERESPIAFSIMIYTNIDRFVRLLRAIYRSSNVYCVHVDAKSPPRFKAAVSKLVSCFDNVFLPDNPIEVEWGYAPVLRQEFVCLEEIWKRKLHWRWWINLTGEEFPLKTNLELVHILAILRGFNDVWIDPCTEKGPERDWEGCREATFKSFRERWEKSPAAPHFVHPFKGQIHVVLSRDMVEYVMLSPAAQEIYNWSLTVDIPDEIFFSTLNANVHLGVPGSNAEYPVRGKRSLARLKLWRVYHERWPHCSFYLRNVCLLSPRELPLLTSSLQLFANKFKPEHRPLGYACLEEWYFRRVVKELQSGRVQLDLRPYYRVYYQYLGF